MSRTRTTLSPFDFDTSTIVKTLKKKASWFRCNAGDFEDDCPRIASEPFISLPVDPFARYTVPSRRLKPIRPSTPLHFPLPPPRSPVSFSPETSVDPYDCPRTSAPGLTVPRHRMEEYQYVSIERQPTFCALGPESYTAKLAASSFTCTGHSDESSGSSGDGQESEDVRGGEDVTSDNASEHGTIFTLFGDSKEWDEFEEALFYLKPSRSLSRRDGVAPTPALSSLPSSPSSTASLSCSSSSGVSSLHSSMTSLPTSHDDCDFH